MMTVRGRITLFVILQPTKNLILLLNFSPIVLFRTTFNHKQAMVKEILDL
jgi:hypothetical protein